MTKLCSVFLLFLLPGLVSAQVPTITAFDPFAGPIGTVVKIEGSNFSTTPASNTVYFGAVKAVVTAAATDELTVVVPVGASFQPITVTVNNLTAYAPEPFVVTFPGAASVFSANSFAPKLDLSVSQQPNYLSAGDFDGDGKADMVVAVQSSGFGVQVLRNTSTTGNIGFTGVTTLPSSTVGMTTTLGDLDNDGRLDIVMADHSNKVTVYRNTSTTGSISFAAGIVVPLGSGSSRGIAIADLDGDGRADMAVTNQNQSQMAVFRNLSSGPGNINFNTAQSFATGSLPYGVAITDLDGDGKADIAVANASSASFSVFRNTSTPGNITLAAKTDFTTGIAPYNLAVVDLDDDGLEEIAVTNSNSNTLSLFENTSSPGSISFGAKQDYATASAPRSVSAGDMDGDGDVDLVVGYNNGTQAVSVFQNTSILNSVSVAAAVNYTVNGSSAFSVLLTDLDNDGKMDMATPSYFNKVISILRNKSSEPGITTFSPVAALSGATVTITGTNFTGTTAVSFGGVPATSFTVVSSTSITAVVGNGASGNVVVTTPSGTGTAAGFTFLAVPGITSFTPATAKTGDTITLTGTYMNTTTSVKFGGVSATSMVIVSATVLKAVVGNGASGSINVSNNNGNSSLPGFTYLPPIAPNFSYGPAGNLYAPALVQLTDLTTGPQPILSWLWNLGNGQTSTLKDPVVLYTSPGLYNIMLAVSDGDTTAFVTKSIQILAPPPVISSFTPVSGPAGTTVTIRGLRFSSTALDNIVYFGATRATVTAATDTTLTVVVPIGATYQPITATVSGLTAFAAQPFIPTYTGGDNNLYFATRIDSAISTTPAGVVVSDVNGDGKPDLAITNQSSNNVAVFRNTSVPDTIRLSPRVNFSTGNEPRYLTSGDIDGDGKPDLVVPNSQAPGTITVLRNTGTGGIVAFAPGVSFATAGYSFPANVAIGDLNADGKPDLVVSDSTNKLYVFENRSSIGSIVFASPVQLALTSYNSNFVAIGDLDGDGKPDLAVANDYSDRVGVFRNTTVNGILAFTAVTDFATASNPVVVAIGDLDGDGKSDLVTANQYANNVSILRNTSTAGNIAFAPRVDSAVGSQPYFVAIGDINGDGKPDIAVSNGVSGSVSVLRNTCTPGLLSFARRINTPTGAYPGGLAIADLDGDGKPDMTTANRLGGTFSLLRNTTGTYAGTILCPGAGTMLPAGIAGSSYQWQISTDSVNFTNLAAGPNYSGTNTAMLTLTNMPSAAYGTVYRCVVDGTNGNRYTIRFVNNWMGAVNNAWEEPGNWSCGQVPDGNTDVVISSGLVVLASNGICRTLTVNTGAGFTIAPGFVLTITR